MWQNEIFSVHSELRCSGKKQVIDSIKLLAMMYRVYIQPGLPQGDVFQKVGTGRKVLEKE